MINISIYYEWKKIEKSSENNKLKISAPIWSEEFKLPDGCNVQEYFEYIIKKHDVVTDNLSIVI